MGLVHIVRAWMYTILPVLVEGQGHCYYLLENLCHRSSDFISRTMLTKLHTSVQYGKISNEFALHDAASKVKVTVNIFRKCLSSL
jgi:hypothetical protein